MVHRYNAIALLTEDHEHRTLFDCSYNRRKRSWAYVPFE